MGSFTKELGAAVARELGVVLPRFELARLGPNVVLSRKYGPKCWCFVMLVVPDGREEFTLEIGWNRVPEYPFEEFADALTDDDRFNRRVLKLRATRFRISSIYGQGRDVWWTRSGLPSLDQMEADLTSFAAAGRVPRKRPSLGVALSALLADALSRVRADVLPLFNVVARTAKTAGRADDATRKRVVAARPQNGSTRASKR